MKNNKLSPEMQAYQDWHDGKLHSRAEIKIQDLKRQLESKEQELVKTSERLAEAQERVEKLEDNLLTLKAHAKAFMEYGIEASTFLKRVQKYIKQTEKLLKKARRYEV